LQLDSLEFRAIWREKEGQEGESNGAVAWFAGSIEDVFLIEEKKQVVQDDLQKAMAIDRVQEVVSVGRRIEVVETMQVSLNANECLTPVT